MVYFKTNYIKEANTWIIRKIRPWVFLVMGGGFFYYFTMYEYHGRRVVFKNKYLDWRTEEEKKKDAEKLRSNFGYHPRYEPKLETSIKKRKYAQQSLEEAINDTPRLHVNAKPRMTNDFGYDDPLKTNSLFHVVLDHARVPGEFDYTVPQTYHAIFPDAEQQLYVEINGNDHKGLKISAYAS